MGSRIAADGRWEGRTGAEWRRVLGAPAVRARGVVGSTNDEARAWAGQGAPAGALVIADAQTDGRGRSGDKWWSPPGLSLYLSAVLRPARVPGAGAAVGVVSLRVGLALAAALEDAFSLDTRIKWPNDLLGPGGGKLAGVLCEAAFKADQLEYVIAGVGVNVGHDVASLPEEIRETATSVAHETGGAALRPALLTALAPRLAGLATAPLEPLSPEELLALDARDALKGRAVRVDGGPELVALGMDRGGALRVAHPSGAITLVQAGRVRPVQTRVGGGAHTRRLE
ncbi:MAG: biotin--[acetyl-CoA-carboxylase] ligase [Gemmatimonadota bacterium]